MPDSNALTIHLSLVSHTNIGKTTLARTLLSRDVGEIADRAHVTENAADYELASTENGDRLVLWDTPGFGNSVALAKRLEGRANPVGWFLSEVWDRVANKALWLNQKALQHVREVSSVVLYLVNAAERPENAPYVQAEMRILAWIGKPVVVVLNQMGQPRPADEETADIERWREATSGFEIVKGVLAMDAFARCWVQEFSLFDTVGEALGEDRKPVYRELCRAWQKKRVDAYSASVEALVLFMEKIRAQSENAPAATLGSQLKLFGKRIGLLKSSSVRDPAESAQAVLSAKAADEMRLLTDTLIEVNSLRGKGVHHELLRRLQGDWSMVSPVAPTGAAVVGAIGSGAVTGLASDLASGGLSMGMGTLIGAIVGAVGGAGLATAYNCRRDLHETVVTWSDEALRRFMAESVLLYLAVSHFGRGRGNWSEGEYPPFWHGIVDAEVKSATAKLNADRIPGTAGEVTKAVLAKLYPDCSFDRQPS